MTSLQRFIGQVLITQIKKNKEIKLNIKLFLKVTILLIKNIFIMNYCKVIHIRLYVYIKAMLIKIY